MLVCLKQEEVYLSGETRADSEEEVACGMGRLGRVRVEVEGSRERTAEAKLRGPSWQRRCLARVAGGGERGSSSWRRDPLENEPRRDASFPSLLATFPVPAMRSSQRCVRILVNSTMEPREE